MDWKWILLITHFIILYSNCDSKEIITQINTKKWIHYVPERFLSMTIDPFTIAAASPLSQESLQMAKGLHPSFVRLSGEGTNFLHFGKEFLKDNSTVTEEQLASVYKFIRDGNLDMIVALNQMNRVDGVWDSRNSLEIISFTDKEGYHSSWQLGHDSKGLNATGEQVGMDIIRLRNILNNFPRYRRSAIFGPDFQSTEQLDFIKELLHKAGPSLTSIVLAPKMTQPHQDDPEKIMWKMIDDLNNHVWNKDSSKTGYSLSKKPIWMADPDPSKGTFADAQTLVKKVGAAAKLGCQLFLRQPGVTSLKRATPDFWFALLYKNLVGRGVLDAKIVSGNRSDVSLFSHCTPSIQPDRSILDTDWNYGKGAVTIFGVVESDEPAKLTVKASVKEESVHIYALTQLKPDKYGEEYTHLNGQQLRLSDNGELPVLSPKVKKAARTASVTLPGNSIFFLVMPDTKIRTCMASPIGVSDIVGLTDLLKITTKELEKSTENDNSSSNDEVTERNYVSFAKKKATERRQNAESRSRRLEEVGNRYMSIARSLLPKLKSKIQEEKIEIIDDPNEDIPVRYITFNDNSWLNKLTEAMGQVDTLRDEDKSDEDKSSEELVTDDKVKKYAKLASAILGGDKNETETDKNNSRAKRSCAGADEQSENEQILKQLNLDCNKDPEVLEAQPSKAVVVKEADNASPPTPTGEDNQNGTSTELISKMLKGMEVDDSSSSEEEDKNKPTQTDSLSKEIMELKTKDDGVIKNDDEEISAGLTLQNITNDSGNVLTNENQPTMINEQPIMPIIPMQPLEIPMENPQLDQESSATNPECQTCPQFNPAQEVAVNEEDQAKETQNIQLQTEMPQMNPQEGNIEELMNANSSPESDEKEESPQPREKNVDSMPRPQHIQRIASSNGRPIFNKITTLPLDSNLMTSSVVPMNFYDNQGQVLMNTKKEKMIDSILTGMVMREDKALKKQHIDPSKVEESGTLVELQIPETKDKLYIPLDAVPQPEGAKQLNPNMLDPGNHLILPDDSSSTQKVVRQVKGGPIQLPQLKKLGATTQAPEPANVENLETPDTPVKSEQPQLIKELLESRRERFEAFKAKLQESRQKILEATARANINNNVKRSMQRREAEIRKLFDEIDSPDQIQDASSSLKIVAIPVPEGEINEKAKPRKLSREDWVPNKIYGSENVRDSYETEGGRNQYLFPLDTRTQGIVYNNKIYPAKLYGVIEIEDEEKSKEHDFNGGLTDVDLSDFATIEHPNQGKQMYKNGNKEEQYIPVVILSPKDNNSEVIEEKKTERTKRSTTEPPIREGHEHCNHTRLHKRRRRNVKEEENKLNDNSIKSQVQSSPMNKDEIDEDGEKFKTMLIKNMEAQGKDLFSLAKRYTKLIEERKLTIEGNENESKEKLSESGNQSERNKKHNEEKKSKDENENQSKEKTTEIGQCEEIGMSKESVIRDLELKHKTEKKESDGKSGEAEGVHVTRIIHFTNRNPDDTTDSYFASFLMEKMKDFLSIIQKMASN